MLIAEINEKTTIQMVPVNEPLLIGNEKKYLQECIDTGWISSDGPFIKKFENLFAEQCNRAYGIAVCNGSVALDVAVQALNIKVDDEVIMPTFTIISCAAAIVRMGAKPVVVDADPLTWNMRVDLIEAKITSKTKAIMVVHLYGLPVDIDPVLELAKKYNLYVIEDAAQAIGMTYKGKPCGSFGDISTFSFYPNKHITTGEGGMVLVNGEKLADRCRSLRNLCFVPERRFVHYELGANYRMTNLQAAIGVAQLERLRQHMEKKSLIGRYYTERLQHLVDKVQLPVSSTSYANNYYWVYALVLKDSVPFDAQEIMTKLELSGVGTRPFFWPIHEQPVFKNMGWFSNESYPVAESIARRGFYIPSGLALTVAQMDYVVESLTKVLG